MLLFTLVFSLFSKAEIALQAVLRDPTAFLYAIESKFLSSSFKSFVISMNFFIYVIISSNLSVCSDSLAIYRNSFGSDIYKNQSYRIGFICRRNYNVKICFVVLIQIFKEIYTFYSEKLFLHLVFKLAY